MGKEKQTILICDNHYEDYQVPLIYTFAFIGAEYWCPFCGYVGGMFGSVKRVPVTEKLIGRRSIYKEYAKAMLSACGSLVCCGMELNKGMIEPKDYPEEMEKELDEMAGSWVYKIKAIKLIKQEVIKPLEFKCVHCETGWKCKDYKKADIEICKKWKRRGK